MYLTSFYFLNKTCLTLKKAILTHDYIIYLRQNIYSINNEQLNFWQVVSLFGIFAKKCHTCWLRTKFSGGHWFYICKMDPNKKAIRVEIDRWITTENAILVHLIIYPTDYCKGKITFWNSKYTSFCELINYSNWIISSQLFFIRNETKNKSDDKIWINE